MATEVKKLTFSHQGLIETHKWYETKEPKAAIILVHGMAEHIERYAGFAERLSKDGFIVYGYNQRGHKGTIVNKDDYGYMHDDDNFMILVSDLYEMVKYVQEENPKLPIFIFGHSMGSFVTQRFVQLHGSKISGIILSGSAKQPRLALRAGILLARLIIRFKGARHRSKLLNNLTFGNYNKYFRPSKSDFDWLNRDENEVKKYIDDEYCGGIFTAAFFRDFFRGLRAINHNFELVPKKLPILLLSGSEDPVGGPVKLITALYNTLKFMEIKDLEFKLYAGARHELLLETNKEEVMKDCFTWLNSRLGKLE
ncbi:MAG: lysophospholipase [Bacilli bacterium]|jgi:alpha-beta hydrolase superfamily lysophospholipase